MSLHSQHGACLGQGIVRRFIHPRHHNPRWLDLAVWRHGDNAAIGKGFESKIAEHVWRFLDHQAQNRECQFADLWLRVLAAS